MDLFGASVQPIVAFFLFGELAVLAALITAFLLGRKHKGVAHHYLMLVVFLADLAVFKPLMYSRATSVYGSFPWSGTSIAPHLLISLVAAFLGATSVVLGFKHRVRKGGKMFLPPKGRMHKVLGWAFLLVWAATFVLGLLIFRHNYLG